MEEMIMLWLINLYDNEIDETQEAIKNEHIWMLGSSDPESFRQHKGHMLVLQEYIDVLKEKKHEVEMGCF